MLSDFESAVSLSRDLSRLYLVRLFWNQTFTCKKIYEALEIIGLKIYSS